ncbi:chemotaxis protein MotA [Novosphingobium sp. FSY-8]|uniref:Chemotaxis protein MotA n=2 Tax=Novosphingobium ovatum TaxID=1908523 RepID=A0ABW9XG20_9SPHN|nr:chemotaxis protein MotA [Novosphingobium ovatum]
MTLSGFWDGTTFAIVVGGTMLATLLRCGWGDVRATLGALGHLLPGRPAFDADDVRARLARQLQLIARDGLLRARPHAIGDPEFDTALDVLVTQRSVPAARDVLAQARARRMRPIEQAIRTLSQSVELAPVFGLAGTLISLSWLPQNGVDRGAYMAAIGMAVHSTLYGLALANLVLAPLYRAIERHALAEEDRRREISEWFEQELGQAFPTRAGHRAPVVHHGPVAADFDPVLPDVLPITAHESGPGGAAPSVS